MDNIDLYAYVLSDKTGESPKLSKSKYFIVIRRVSRNFRQGGYQTNLSKKNFWQRRHQENFSKDGPHDNICTFLHKFFGKVIETDRLRRLSAPQAEKNWKFDHFYAFYRSFSSFTSPWQGGYVPEIPPPPRYATACRKVQGHPTPDWFYFHSHDHGKF